MDDARLPAMPRQTAAGLILPFEQMHHEVTEMARQRVLLANPQALYLLRQVGKIEGLCLLITQQRGLLLCPGIEVLLVERRMAAHRQSSVVCVTQSRMSSPWRSASHSRSNASTRAVSAATMRARSRFWRASSGNEGRVFACSIMASRRAIRAAYSSSIRPS